MSYFIMSLVMFCITTMMLRAAIKSEEFKKGNLSAVAAILIIIGLYIASIGLPYTFYSAQSNVENGVNTIKDALDI